MDRTVENFVSLTRPDRTVTRVESQRTVVHAENAGAVATRTAVARSVFRDVDQRVVLSSGVQGPRGAPGTSAGVIPPIAFSYGDAPQIVFTAPADGYFTTTRLHIETAFDGVGAQITVGVIGNVSALMMADGNVPELPAIYDCAADYFVTAGTGVWLEITPGFGATQGAGFLFLNFIAES